MLSIKCAGTPYEIGKQHGSAAADQVKGSIVFYETFFKKQTKKTWPEVCEVARTFLPYLTASWPDYVEEMKGLADGAGVSFDAVLALNVRTEIGYGLLSDGCTAFSWKTEDASFIGQNWDWEHEQSPNIISLHVQQPGEPRIAMMTEAGIIGKIGLNSAGVGVTLNALKALGADVGKLPTHLALRTVLNSTSQNAARETLLRSGLSAACHITIADFAAGGTGLECTSADIVELEMEHGMCTHSNHMLRPHAIEDLLLVQDSPFRVQRIQKLLKEAGSTPTMDGLTGILKDEKNYPAAICRAPSGTGTIQTLFSIVMDLKGKYATVKMGRPTEGGESLEIRP